MEVNVISQKVGKLISFIQVEFQGLVVIAMYKGDLRHISSYGSASYFLMTRQSLSSAKVRGLGEKYTGLGTLALLYGGYKS